MLARSSPVGALIACAVAASALAAQSVDATHIARARRPLTVDDYAIWNSVRGAELSPDGNAVLYTVAPGLGNGEVVLQHLRDQRLYRHTRGFIGRQQLEVGELSNPQLPSAVFAADGRYAVFTIEASRDDVERAAPTRPSMPGPRVFDIGIMDVNTGAVRVLSGASRFRIPRLNRSVLVYVGQPSGRTVLIARDLRTDRTDSIASTGDFDVDDAGSVIAYSVSASGQQPGVYVRRIGQAESRLVFPDGAVPGTLKLSSDARALAFFARDTASGQAVSPRVRLIVVNVNSSSARDVALPRAVSDRFAMDPRFGIRFAADNQVLVWGATALPDTLGLLSAQERTRVDLWTWRNPAIEPFSRVARPTMTLAYLLANGRLTVIGDDSLASPVVTVAAHAPIALASSDARYRFDALPGGGYRDYDVIDLRSGLRRRIATHVSPNAALAPDGSFVLYFPPDSKWHALELSTGTERNLTAGAGVRFDQESWSYPMPAAPWGIAGWTTDGSILLYDRYDVWQFDLRGKKRPLVLTESAGRVARRTFRIVDTSGVAGTFDGRGALILRSVDEETKQTGYWRMRLGRAARPDSLRYVSKTLGMPARARAGDSWLFTQESFTESPDLWVAGKDFTLARQVTHVNPQQTEFRWGTSELVEWRDVTGATVRGILYKPEEFDSARTYPLVICVYERLSQHRFLYKPPEPSAEVNRTIYVSNGYLVFEPDIRYEMGKPGESALRSVESGVRSLLERGFVDSTKIGIQGISWGGFESAYIASHSRFLRAAVFDSPVTDLVFDYGAFAYDSWMSRYGSWEYSQGRIGASVWSRPDLYLTNSPIMAADRITVPTLIMANDGDGTVPWTEGLELYVALRRLGREVYLLNYYGDQHQPGALANRVDIAKRTFQFFDVHLRGAPPPRWMSAAR